MKNILIKDITIGENIRKNVISENSVKDLAKSIEAVGMLHPIVVGNFNTKPEGYLLIAGHRRLKAAELLEYKTITALIIEMPDVTSIQIAENIQRVDLTPSEESEAFNKVLNTKDGLTVQDIAAITGKSISYVHSIANLINLIKRLRNMLATGEISLSIAMHFSKFPKNLQEELVDWNWTGISLKEAIQRTDNMQFLLSSAPFDLTKAYTTKSCIGCPTRTGALGNLFPENKKDEKCLDVNCFKSKCIGNVVEKVNKMYKDGKDFVLLSESYSNQQLSQISDYENEKIPDLTVYGTEKWSKTKKATKGAKLGIVVKTYEPFEKGSTIYVKMAGVKTTKEEIQKAKDAGESTPVGKADDMYFSSIELSKKREDHEVFTKVINQIKNTDFNYINTKELKDLLIEVFTVIDFNDLNRLETILFPDEKDLIGEGYTNRVNPEKVWKKYIQSQKTDGRIWESANKWIFLILMCAKVPSDPKLFYDNTQVQVLLKFGERLGIKVKDIKKKTAPEYEIKRKLKLERFEKNHGRKPKKS